VSEAPKASVDAARALRAAFDAAFAAPPVAAAAAGDAFLALQVGATAYAVRVAEVSGLDRHRRVVPVPAASGGLLGLMGRAGKLVPVYDLATVLGRPSPPLVEDPWLVLCGVAEPVAFACAVVAGFRRADGGATEAEAAATGAREHVSGALRLDGRVAHVLSLPSIVAALYRRAGLEGARAGP
jgi:purine-binding chemotaxis protein CheW